MRSRISSSSLSYTPALATLVFGKASRVFAAFVSFHYLQDKVALPLYLFFVTFGAATTLLVMQRPWNGKRIGSKRTRRVLSAGGLLVATLYIWTAGLRSAGPLRTLLVDGAELPLLYLFAVMTRREMPERRKTRGALCMLLAYFLLIWDASGHVPDVKEIENSRFGQRAEHMVDRITHHQWRSNHNSVRGLANGDENGRAGADNEFFAGFGQDEDDSDGRGGGRKRVHSRHLSSPHRERHHHHHDGMGAHGPRRRLLTTFHPPVQGPGGVKDAFVEGTALRSEFGVILVLAASVLVQGGRGFTRRLATELGGAKRHFALSMAVAVVWMMPLAFLSWLSDASGAVLSLQAIGGVTRINITSAHALGFFAVGFLWLVLPYYARAIVSTAVPSRVMMQAAVVVPFIMAAVVSSVFGGAEAAGGLSWVLLAAFILECLGVSLMMAGGVNRAGLSELPIDANPTASAAAAGAALNNSPSGGGATGATGVGGGAQGQIMTSTGTTTTTRQETVNTVQANGVMGGRTD